MGDNTVLSYKRNLMMKSSRDRDTVRLTLMVVYAVR